MCSAAGLLCCSLETMNVSAVLKCLSFFQLPCSGLSYPGFSEQRYKTVAKLKSAVINRLRWFPTRVLLPCVA